MFIRLLIAVFVVTAFAGCATTSSKPANPEQLQSRVTDLEKKLEEKDSEIVDLQYEVKDLSSKVGGDKSSASKGSDDESSAPAATPSRKGGVSEDILRVNVDPETVQSALKAAGLYTGKVDGKIGPGTKAAIIKFQKSQGLKADGILGKKTWDELKKYSK